MTMHGAAPAKLTITDSHDSVVVRPVPATSASPVVAREYSPGAPSVREASTPLIGADGHIDGTAFTGERALTLDLVIRGDETTSAYAYAERLAGFTHPSRRPFLYAERYGVTTGGAWRMPLRGNPFSITYGRRSAAMLEMQLAFTSPGGYWESPWQEASAAGDAAHSTGLVLPAPFPWSFGSGGNTPAIPLTVASTVPVAPMIVVYGPAVDPEIITDAGELFAFSGLTLTSGQFVVIDMATGTVTLNGDPTSSVYHLVDWQRSRFFRLAAGDRQISVIGDTGNVIVRWRDRRFTI